LSADVLLERAQRRFEAVTSRIVASDLRSEGGGLRLCTREGNAGFEATNQCDSVSPGVCLFAERKGKVDINMSAGGKDAAEVKGRGQDADDEEDQGPTP